MDEYNFWKDLLDTFQSSSDWVQAVWLIVPPMFVLILIRMIMRFRLARHSVAEPTPEPVVYQIHHPVNEDWMTAELDRLEQDMAPSPRRLTHGYYGSD